MNDVTNGVTLTRTKAVKVLEKQIESGEGLQHITIAPPNFRTIHFRAKGTAPLMQQRFTQKAIDTISQKMKLGTVDSKKQKRPPRDFDEDFRLAQHISTEGWVGHPASAFRSAAIDVCRVCGYKMTYAKMSIFICADGLDKVDGIPLVKLIAGPPENVVMAVRNATGVADLRARPVWREWAVALRVRFDADQFTDSDVANLLERAGQQIGIGEGRPFSRDSNGLDFGMFTIRGE